MGEEDRYRLKCSLPDLDANYLRQMAEAANDPS